MLRIYDELVIQCLIELRLYDEASIFAVTITSNRRAGSAITQTTGSVTERKDVHSVRYCLAVDGEAGVGTRATMGGS